MSQSLAAPTSLWRNGNFVKLWTAETVSALGTQVSMIAVPLTAVVYLRAGTFEVGLLVMFETLAYLIVGLPSGPLVDRSRKRRVMLVTNLGRMLALASIPFAALFGTLTMAQMYAVALVVGLLGVPFAVAYQSYLPLLVDPRMVVEGSSRMQAGSMAMEIVGPGVGGVLIGLVTAPVAILVDAASFLCSTVLIRSIPAALEERPAPGPKRHFGAEIREGLRFVLGHPALRAIAGCSATVGLFEGMDGAVIVVFLSRTLRASTAYVGVIFSVCAVGGLIGAFAAARLARTVGSARLLIWSIGVASPFAYLTVVAQPGWSTILVGLGGLPLWIGLVVYNTTAVGFRQLMCPAEMRGRLNATMQVINRSFAPVGVLLGSVLGAWLGPRTTLFVAASGLSLAVLWLLCSPIRGARDLSAWNVRE